MKIVSIASIIVLMVTRLLYSQNVTDSLVTFSDLKYHSEFERIALSDFVHQKKDTFNLFLAIDADMKTEEAGMHYTTYKKIFKELEEKKIASKPLKKKIEIVYADVHGKFLNKYNENEYYPVMFRSGTYNCVSASMLYALVFGQLEIPYKVMVSSNHVYLVANPGTNSIVIETTNPSFEKAIFTGEFKQQYVNYLRNSKLISESECKNTSVEEIFEAKFNEVKEAEFSNLPGFQYYNKALYDLQNNKIEEAYALCQKAYFFYPVQQVKTLLYNTLLLQIEKCNFEKISDIDYLAQFSRFENADLNLVVGMFNNVIAHYLEYTDKEAYCNSLFQRLTSKITDKTTIEEISFSYYMQMSYRFQNTNNVGYYASNALKIRGNNQNANVIMEGYIQRKLSSISNPYALIDTIEKMENKYTFERILPILKEQKMIAYLKIASDLYKNNKAASGEKYLQQFEGICVSPVEDRLVGYWVEKTYRTIAMYCYYTYSKTRANSIVNRGLKYVPDSEVLKSAY